MYKLSNYPTLGVSGNPDYAATAASVAAMLSTGLHVLTGFDRIGKAVAISGVGGYPIALLDLTMSIKGFRRCPYLDRHLDCHSNLLGRIKEQTLIIDGSGETWTYH